MKDERVNLNTCFKWNIVFRLEGDPTLKADRWTMFKTQNTAGEGGNQLRFKVFAYIQWGCYCCRAVQTLPVLRPQFASPRASSASVPALSTKSPSARCNPAYGTTRVLIENWHGVGRGAALGSQALSSGGFHHGPGPISHRGGNEVAARPLLSLPPKISSSQTHVPSAIAKYTVPSPARSF